MTTADYLTQLQQDREDFVDNLETMGITGLTGDETFTELVPEVLNISGESTPEVEKKDVNFYDYDGKRLYSYTKSEFSELTYLPENPTHAGLTSQGWNWNMLDCRDYLAIYDKLNVGQTYITDDGATRIYIELTGERLSPYLGFAINGTATVNWGDGTASTVTGTTYTTNVYTQHNYAHTGKYVISISSTEKIYFVGSSTMSRVLVKSSTVSNEDQIYLNCIKRVEFGSNINVISDYAFFNCRCLKDLIIPKGITSIGRSSFRWCCSIKFISLSNTIDCLGAVNDGMTFLSCGSLERVIITPGLVNMWTSCFQYCYSLSDIILFDGINIAGDGNFAYCYSLSSIIPPKNKGLNKWTFQWCYGMKYYDLSHFTTVVTLNNTDCFEGIPSDCKIIVPDDLYSSWIAANNWSTYASNIIKKSDWDNLQS